MKHVFLALSLVGCLSLLGCSRGGDPIDIGVGDAGISGGTGGEESGPTGTQGTEPADNPAADLPNAVDANGSGGPQ